LFTADAAVFIEVAKRRTLRDIKFAADANPYSARAGRIITTNWYIIHVDLCAVIMVPERAALNP
jgi:hypothetical protein